VQIDEAKRPPKDPADTHLRSAQEVTGYYIEASDGEIGRVDGFVTDDEDWAIPLHRGGNAEVVAGKEGAGFTRMGGTARPPYWLHEAEHQSSLFPERCLSGVALAGSVLWTILFDALLTFLSLYSVNRKGKLSWLVARL